MLDAPGFSLSSLFTPLLISSNLMALNTLNSTPMYPTTTWWTCTLCKHLKRNISKTELLFFPLPIFHSQSFPSQFMEPPSFYSLRTKIPGVILDFFISLTFTFSPSANLCLFYLPKYPHPTAPLHPHCSPQVQNTVISLLDYCPSSSMVSVPTLKVRTLCSEQFSEIPSHSG